MELTFTGLGSLIHPLAMFIILAGWLTTFVFGLSIRRARLSPAHGEQTPILERNLQVSSLAKKSHHKLSSALLVLTVLFTMVGMYNTYCRKAKLFPGPHLYGAFWFILAVSVNVALVPWFASLRLSRPVHAAVGIIILLLLVNQIWSGIPILQGVWSDQF